MPFSSQPRIVSMTSMKALPEPVRVISAASAPREAATRTALWAAISFSREVSKPMRSRMTPAKRNRLSRKSSRARGWFCQFQVMG